MFYNLRSPVYCQWFVGLNPGLAVIVGIGQPIPGIKALIYLQKFIFFISEVPFARHTGVVTSCFEPLGRRQLAFVDDSDSIAPDAASHVYPPYLSSCPPLPP